MITSSGIKDFLENLFLIYLIYIFIVGVISIVSNGLKTAKNWVVMLFIMAIPVIVLAVLLLIYL